ncbi:hypothetical protein [Novosphingobium sp.]|uniref:hypothetical protein n=1 Tax=Novosphingobium sp. TaxID=1874826 RepID=UPI00333FDC6C
MPKPTKPDHSAVLNHAVDTLEQVIDSLQDFDELLIIAHLQTALDALRVRQITQPQSNQS